MSDDKPIFYIRARSATTEPSTFTAERQARQAPPFEITEGQVMFSVFSNTPGEAEVVLVGTPDEIRDLGLGIQQFCDEFDEEESTGVDWEGWAKTVPTPTCPACGQPPQAMASLTQVFCGNEDCRVFMWNPTEDGPSQLATAQEVRIEKGEMPGGEGRDD